MTAADDERVLLHVERDLSADRGVRSAFDAFEAPRNEDHRRRVATAIGAILTVGVVGAGRAGSPIGSLVLLATALAVYAMHRRSRRVERR